MVREEGFICTCARCSRLENANGSPETIRRATIIADVLQDCVSKTAAQHKNPPPAKSLLTRRKSNSKWARTTQKLAPNPPPPPNYLPPSPLWSTHARQRSSARCAGSSEVRGLSPAQWRDRTLFYGGANMGAALAEKGGDCKLMRGGGREKLG